MRPSHLRHVVAVFAAVVGLLGTVASAAGSTADWSHVSVACVPDDTNTTPDRYDATSSGLIMFDTGAVGDLWFWCNVLSPLDSYADNPSWNALFVTFKDTNSNGFVEVKLIRKRKNNGATATVATFTSTDGVGVREAFQQPLPAFNFGIYAYFVRIQLHRDTTSESPEIHIVSLKETLF